MPLAPVPCGLPAIPPLIAALFGCLLALPVAGVEAPPSPVSGASVTFHFNPPDGSQVERTVVRIVQRDLDGAAGHRDEARSVTVGRFQRTGSGWSFKRHATGFEFRHDGEVAVNPIAELEARAELDYRLEPDGHVHEIKGFAGMDDRLQKAYAPDVAIRFAPAMKFMSEEALIAQERDDWNARYAELSGRTVALGSEESHDMQYPLPTGVQLSYQARTRFLALEPCPAGSCVRIEIVYASAAPGASGDRLSGRATRLVDPATLRVYEEHFERSVVAILQTAGKPAQTLTRKEEIRYTWRYP